MQITLEHELKNVSVFLDEFKKKALINAARMSMNRAIVGVAGRANSMIREQRKLKASEVRRNFNVVRAKGNNLATMQARLEVSGKPLSLIHFVVGKQAPRNQKGIPTKKRKKIQVEVVPGRKFTLNKVFIAKGRGGAYQLFQRRGAGRFPIVKQTAGALSLLASRDAFKNALQEYGRERLGIEFKQAFDFELAKVAAKARGVKR